MDIILTIGTGSNSFELLGVIRVDDDFYEQSEKVGKQLIKEMMRETLRSPETLRAAREYVEREVYDPAESAKSAS